MPQIRDVLLGMNEGRNFAAYAKCVVGIALLCRFAVMFGLWSSWPWQSGQVADGWNQLAINLLDNGTFGFSPNEPTIGRGPIFPLLELPLYWLWGQNYAFWCAALLVFDVGTCGLIMLLGRQIWGNRPALLAGAYYAIYFPVIYYTAKISQFTSILPLVFLWFCLITIWDKNTDKKWPPLALGLVSGVLILNKTVYLLAPLVGAVALVWFHRKSANLRKQLLPGIAICAVVTATVIAPWTYRNYNVTNGRFIPVQSLFWGIVWQDIMISELDATVGRVRPAGETLAYFNKKFQEMISAEDRDFLAKWKGPAKEIREEQLYAAAVKNWVAQHPTRYAVNVLNNTWQFWVRAENLQKTLQFAALQSVFLALALAGLWFLYLNRQLGSVKYGLLVILLVWFEHIPVIGWGRHSLDLAPILAVVFAAGIHLWLLQFCDRTPSVAGSGKLA